MVYSSGPRQGMMAGWEPGVTGSLGDWDNARLAHLQLLDRTGRAANRAGDLIAAASAVLAEVCRSTGGVVGHLLVAGGLGPRILEPGRAWYVAEPGRFEGFRTASEASVVRAGQGLSGRVLASGKPVAVADLRSERSEPLRAPAAEQAGLGGGFAFPVITYGEVAAVVEIFGEHRRLPEPGLLDVIAHVGGQLAQVALRDQVSTALRRTEERLRAVVESARDALITLDEDAVIVGFNPAAEAMFGQTRLEAMGRRVYSLVPEANRGAGSTVFREIVEGDGHLPRVPVELPALRADGTTFPAEATITAWQADGHRFFTLVVRDISERKEAEHVRRNLERRLARHAREDPLTYLPNRLLLRDRLSAALLAAADTSDVALLVLDLDRFRIVNDELGTSAGDQLLRAVATRLQSVLRPTDTLAKIGPDEFAVLLVGVSGRIDAVRHAQRMLDCLGDHFSVLGSEVAVTAAAGLAVAAPGTTADRVSREAEAALLRARRRGGGVLEVFDDSLRANPAGGLAMEVELRRGIDNGELRLHYQPIFDLASGAPMGVEALVRWQHPTRGLLSPAEFVVLAEETGLIMRLGSWVLNEALEQARSWQIQRPHAPLQVSVNVSSRQLHRDDWACEVAGAVRASRVGPGVLVLELSERMLMDDDREVRHRLSELRDMGVLLALDDFGTGYASLAALRALPVDILKVDKSFIDGVAGDDDESAYARAIIQMATTLKLHTVAEGIESRSQCLALRRLGCRYGQGFYLAEPEPAPAISELLAGSPAATGTEPS